MPILTSKRAKVLENEPNCPSRHYNLGLALYHQGRYDEAISQYEQTLTILCDFAEAHNNLGVIHYELSKFEKAKFCFERALAINPYLAEAYNNLGIVLKLLGKAVSAIIHHQISIRLCPEENLYYVTFSKCLSDLRITHICETLKDDIISIFANENINHQALAFPCASIINSYPSFVQLCKYIEINSDRLSFQELFDAGLSDLYADPLFLALLKNTIVRDPNLERILRITRSSLLKLAIEFSFPKPIKPELITFISVLACQCFYNEYVYGVTEIEIRELCILKNYLLSHNEIKRDLTKIIVAIIACYIPLYQLKQDEMFMHLSDSASDCEIASLISQQIINNQEEKRLINKIESIGNITDQVSLSVSSHYQENPYPRWLKTHKQEEESFFRVIQKQFPHIPREQILDNPTPKILVAGCGTGQQVIDRALQVKSAKILGVDISLTSLAYAKRKAIELEITNAEFKRIDILNLPLINQSFDLIESIGVLHHMKDPFNGWRILSNLLKPGAFMRIGLYSKIARKDIFAAQSFVKENGYKAIPNSIRECRQHILSLSNQSNVKNVTKIFDFYTLSETRDLLFHSQEKCFTLLEIADYIDKLGLKFLGFELNNSLEKENYLTLFPEDPTAISIQNWHMYELDYPNAFIGLYLFWLQKPT